LKNQFKVESLIIGYDHRFGHNRSEGFNEYCQYGKEIGMDVLHI
jgi:riboflavin kinase/FMN adenylyltransferase